MNLERLSCDSWQQKGKNAFAVVRSVFVAVLSEVMSAAVCNCRVQWYFVHGLFCVAAAALGLYALKARKHLAFLYFVNRNWESLSVFGTAG